MFSRAGSEYFAEAVLGKMSRARMTGVSIQRPIAVTNGLEECMLLIVNHAIGFKLHVGFVGVGSTSMSTSFPVIFIIDVCVNKSSRLYFP